MRHYDGAASQPPDSHASRPIPELQQNSQVLHPLPAASLKAVHAWGHPLMSLKQSMMILLLSLIIKSCSATLQKILTLLW